MRRCYDLRALLRLTPVSMLFQFATVLRFVSLKYLPPDMVVVCCQMNLVLLAVVMRFVIKKKYHTSQWIALILISLAMLMYLHVRDEGHKGAQPLSDAAMIRQGLAGLAGMLSGLAKRQAIRALSAVVSPVPVYGRAWAASLQAWATPAAVAKAAPVIALSPNVLQGMCVLFVMCIVETIASVLAEKYFKGKMGMKERTDAFYIQKVHVDFSGLIFVAFWCYWVEPFLINECDWSCRPQRCRQVIEHGLFYGWDWWTVAVLGLVVAKMWLSSWIAKILDSVVKQLGSCAATVLTYLEVLWLYPNTSYDFETMLSLAVVVFAIASFAVSTRTVESLKNLKQRHAAIGARGLGHDGSGWAAHYGKPALPAARMADAMVPQADPHKSHCE